MDFLKRNCNIYAPVTGKVISIEKIPDEVFASKSLGDGLAFEIEGSKIYAPCNGKIKLITETKHAMVIRNGNGVEIMIHIGLNTVELEGKGFEIFVKENQKVKKGDLLVEIDLKVMQEYKIDLTTVVVIIDDKELDYKILEHNKKVEAGKDKVIVF